MRKICVTFVCIELHYGIKTRVEHMAAIEQLFILFVALLLLIHFSKALYNVVCSNGVSN